MVDEEMHSGIFGSKTFVSDSRGVRIEPSFCCQIGCQNGLWPFNNANWTSCVECYGVCVEVLIRWFLEHSPFGGSCHGHVFERIMNFLIVPAQFGMGRENSMVSCRQQVEEIMRRLHERNTMLNEESYLERYGLGWD